MVEKLIGKLKTYYTLNKTKENDSKIANSGDTVSRKQYEELLEKFNKSESIRKQQKDLIFSMRKEMQSHQ